MLMTMKNIPGGGDYWAPDSNGAIQVKTTTINDETIVFNNVPANELYGYEAYVDMANSYNAQHSLDVTPIKQIGDLVFGTLTNGVYSTVTVNITKVTAAQEGATSMLRILR